MDQPLRVCRWPHIAIFAGLFATYAILPSFRAHSHQASDVLRQETDLVQNSGAAYSLVDVLPPSEETNMLPSDLNVISQAVIVKTSAAISSEFLESSVLDEEAADVSASISPASSAPSTSDNIGTTKSDTFLTETSASKAPLSEDVEALQEQQVSGEKVDKSIAPALEPSSLPQSTTEQSRATVAQTTPEKEEPALVAHLPKATSMPPEAVKPEPLEGHYPTTGMEPLKPYTDLESLKPPASYGLERSNTAEKESAAWTEPAALLSILDELGKSKESSDWAGETAQLVRELGSAITGDSDQAGVILDRLADLRTEALHIADSSSDRSLARKLRQASFAIDRRLDVWREIERLGASAFVEADGPKLDSRRLSTCLAEVDGLMKTSAEGRQWRKYLLVDALKELADQRAANGSETERQRKITRQVLARMIETPMSARQRQFIASEPMARFCLELRHWAAEPLTSADVLRDIERYEQTRLPSDARQLAENLRSLAQSSDPKRGELARSVETHYRNANIRTSLTEDLLNRLVPQRKTEIAPVRDTLLGFPVRGESMTSTDVALRLIPDPDRVRMALEITGEVAAMTSSTSGPATFFNDSDALYAVRKPFEIDQKGIKLMPSEVDVRHQTRLRDVATDFDGIPLLGMVARSVARQQHELARPQANEEARNKVADKARKRIDSEARERLAELVNNLNRKVFGPLANLSLEPTMIEAQTTRQRMTMRLRVAGEDQLGSFTPRPQAPENSLASFQINESMLNNALQRLQLEGRTFTLPQLIERVSERFQRPNLWKIDPNNEDLTISFAKKDAVALRCQDGQVILTLNIAEISKEPRQWKNFQVRVFYRPQVNGRSAELVRDGVIHLICQRMSNGSQIALRGIFAKAFPQNESIKLTPDRFVSDAKLRDLAITQFVVDDGWIGFAVGPKEYALRMTQLPTARK
jgi:hypothetical protein